MTGESKCESKTEGVFIEKVSACFPNLQVALELELDCLKAEQTKELAELVMIQERKLVFM
jgi:hypothetical protein